MDHHLGAFFLPSASYIRKLFLVMLHLCSTPAIVVAGPSRILERRRRLCLGFVLAMPMVGASCVGPSCASMSAQTSPAVSTATQTHDVRGQVVNALDGLPLPRALVSVNTRSALTDYQGRFEFAGFTGANAFATVRKPGFSASPDGAAPSSTERLTDLDAPVLIKLYPDALVVGTLTSRDGAPLSHVSVRLLRSQYDGVTLRWTSGGFAQTNAKGEYRISTPAGRFRIATSFVSQSFETGEAILPVSFPESTQSNASILIQVRSGEERRVDLNAKVGPLYPVTLHVEPANSQRMNLMAAVTTSAGDEFVTGVSSDQQLELPTGTYALRVKVNNREEAMTGTSSVTVTGHDLAFATVHLTPDTQITVELLGGTLAPSSQGSNSSINNSLPQLPNVQMFNLSLQNQLATSENQEQEIRPRQEADKTTSFRVPPGRYRLAASGGGQWYVQSATLGATDLLVDELVIGPGSAGGALRLVVSNQTGTVHARTNLPAGASAWMYLVPRGPSLVPIRPISVTSSNTVTSIATALVPPGAYTALLLDVQLQTDPRDPAFLASLVSGPIDIDVQPSADTSFSLDLAKRKAADR